MSVITQRRVQVFETGAGVPVFQLPLEAFPGFWGFAYLVLVGEYKVLIDTGSGFGQSNEGLESGFRRIGEILGRSIQIENLTHILITHGHIDHFGGLAYLTGRTQAQIGIHELDRRNLVNYEERVLVVSRRLDSFLQEAGVKKSRRRKLLEMYNFHKALFQSVNVDFSYQAIGMKMGPFEFLHVPGHCAGHVVIRFGDILFSGDHILAEISPHQAPESLTLNTGLSHYLRSLDEVTAWAGDVRLTLGGHRAPVVDLPARVAEIRSLHMARLNQVREFLQGPHTVAEISHHLFGVVSGYNVLLALEETGAHVEYLYQRGELGIANPKALATQLEPAPIIYQRLS